MLHSTITRVSRTALAGTVLAAGLTGTLAIAAPSVPSAPTAVLATDDAHVKAGDMLVLRGHDFPRGVHITLRAGRTAGKTTRIGDAHTGRRGSFVAQIRIDRDAAAGHYVASACHDRCRIKATVSFHVQRP